MDNDQVEREVGQAIRALQTHDSAAMATGLLEDGSNDDSGPVLPLRCLHKHTAEHPPHLQPTNSESEEDWALSNDDASGSEPRRRLCKKPTHRPDMPAHARGSPKRRKVNLAGHRYRNRLSRYSATPPIPRLRLTRRGTVAPQRLLIRHCQRRRIRSSCAMETAPLHRRSSSTR